MGNKKDGGAGLGTYLLIILFLAFLVDYIGMFNVPYIHSIDEKYVHPKLDPVLSPYLSKIGLMPSFPTTLDAINKASIDEKHTVTGGHFESTLEGQYATLNGVVMFSSPILDGTRIGVAEVVTVKLYHPNEALKTKLGADYDEYASLYNKTGGTIVLIYYNDDVQYSKASTGVSASAGGFGNITASVSISGIIIKGDTLKLAKTEGYKYFEELEKFAGEVPLQKSAKVVLFDRVGNKWFKMGYVSATVTG